MNLKRRSSSVSHSKIIDSSLVFLSWLILLYPICQLRDLFLFSSRLDFILLAVSLRGKPTYSLSASSDGKVNLICIY